MPPIKTRLLNLHCILIATFVACLPVHFPAFWATTTSPRCSVPILRSPKPMTLFTIQRTWIDAEPGPASSTNGPGCIALVDRKHALPVLASSGRNQPLDRPFLWHNTPALMHLHSLLWYLGLGYLICLFRQLTANEPSCCWLAIYLLDSPAA